MKSLFKFLFWYWYPAPKVGQVYIFNNGDPWNNHYYNVIAQKGNWYRIRSQRYGGEESKHRIDLVTFYKLIGEIGNKDEEVPF